MKRRMITRPQAAATNHAGKILTMPGIVKNFPAWFVAAACGLVIILLFILLSTLLGSSAERVIEKLGK